MNHVVKLENLDITKEYADQIIETLKAFAEELGFQRDRIEELECRRRDGFIPYSHNKGGIDCIAFNDRYRVEMTGGTGFPNADATLEKYAEYDIECFLGEDCNSDVPKDQNDWTESHYDRLDEYRQDDSESTVMYSLDMMLTSENELNLRFCICVKDAPYHRQYDDLMEFDINFDSITSLKKQLTKLSKDKEISKFSDLLTEAY